MPSRVEGNRTESNRALVAVVLAAGDGDRLRAGKNAPPKPLVSLRGLSLAERCVARLQEGGIERFVVVIGSEAGRVRAHFEEIARRRSCRIDFALTESWRKGNGCSAAAAAALVGEAPFLLTMVDHLLSPGMIRTVLAHPPAEGEVVLAVDRETGAVFDEADLTKVLLTNGRIAAIGKDLASWNGGDTGLFYGTSALFAALARAREKGLCSLTDGVRELLREGALRAVDVTGERWIDVDTPESLCEADRRIVASLAKESGDGFVSRYLNRPISRRVSVHLARTALTPNAVTFFTFGLGLLGAAALATTETLLWVAGGVLLQLASILDGCDGEIARMKHMQSRRGAWLDTVLDRYADLAAALAVTIAAVRIHDAAWIGPAGLVAAASFLLASYVTKEFELRFGRPYPDNLATRLKRRDLRILALAAGAVAGHPYAALLATGALTHGTLLWILIDAWCHAEPLGAREPLVPVVASIRPTRTPALLRPGRARAGTAVPPSTGVAGTPATLLAPAAPVRSKAPPVAAARRSAALGEEADWPGSPPGPTQGGPSDPVPRRVL